VAYLAYVARKSDQMGDCQSVICPLSVAASRNHYGLNGLAVKGTRQWPEEAAVS